MFNLPDSLFFSIRYEQALCNYLNNDPNQSLLNIEEIRFRFPDSLKTMDIIPLNILCLNTLRKWDEAIAKFHEVYEMKHDKTSKIYIDRCEEFKKDPPSADWDGVYVMTTK